MTETELILYLSKVRGEYKERGKLLQAAVVQRILDAINKHARKQKAKKEVPAEILCDGQPTRLRVERVQATDD